MTDGGPAFPWISDEREKSGMIGQGMSLRDYFAAQVIPLLGNYLNSKEMAADAYKIADAMLAERAKIITPTERPNNP